MKTLAAILVETGKPLVLEEIGIPDLKEGQVLVEVKYSGVCHTQVSECRGYRGPDAYLPHCLGHEGTGVVTAVGPGVTRVKEADAVLLSWMKGQGADVPGTVYSSSRGRINAGAITTFARHSVVSENRVTPLPSSISLGEAAMLGCAVPTGVGAVFNTAQAKPGQSILVFGVGGVGLCAVAGAVLAGCNPIVAIDVNDSKLRIAKEMGATHTICLTREELVPSLQQISKAGFDIAIEASGRPVAMQQALESVRSMGGIAVILGNARFGEQLQLDPRQLNQGKQLRGSWGGDNQPSRDFPMYVDYLLSGTLNVKPLVTSTYSLSGINRAIDDLENGKVIRPLIGMDLGTIDCN